MPLYIVRKDITKMKVDAIVNTTNKHMIGTAGVDLAVHKCAGPLLYEECKSLTPLGLGTAKITKGYELPAKYIIHTSGPVWKGGYVGESILLRSCYIESLKLAVENGCESIAFPLISSGTYGYPKDQVLKFAVDVITEFLADYELTAYICVFDPESYEFSKTLYAEISSYIDNVDVLTYKSTPLSPKYKSKKMVQAEMPQTEISRLETPQTEISRLEMPQTEISRLEMPQAKPTESDIISDSHSIDGFIDISDIPLHDFVKETDKSFAYKLFDLIDQRNMSDPECYKKANVDKKTFSKIRCNPDTYTPSKQTAVAFALALKLDMKQTQDLLASAGLTLSTSFTFDKIIMYFIEKQKYNVHDINIALFEFNQKTLGSVDK